MNKTIEFHLHINHFGPALPKVLDILRDRRGFSPACDQLKEGGKTSPLWIVTKKLDTRDEANEEFSNALKLMREDETMHGYMECEMVTDGSIARFEEKPYDDIHEFPLSRPEFVVAPRGADIHIFRDLETPYDELDVRLEKAGFYEVATDEERIWTFLMQDANDAERLFQALAAHFEVAGGISKIEKEIVQMLETSPQTFVLKEVAKAGFF